MKDRRAKELSDRLGQLARAASPPPLSAAGVDRLVERALDRGLAAPAPRRGSRGAWLAAAAAVVLAAAGGWILRGSDETVVGSGELPTGDRFVTTPDASYEVESVTPDARRFAVRRGTVLFDVAPLADDERFEVRTPDLTVHVRGTVFSVETRGGGTTVRVYEGAVEVVDRHVAQRVRVGRMYRTAAGTTEPLSAGPLGEAGRAAARRRVVSAPVAAARPVRRDEPAPPGSVAAPGAPEPEPAELAPLAPEPEPATGSVAPPAPEAAPAASSVPTSTRVRALLRARRFEAALALARRGETSDPELALLRADALRALGRSVEAADAYDAAATRLGGARRAQAGYLAARLRFGALGEPAGALASLDAAGVDGSAMAERSLALRVRALLALGRDDEARAVARRYLTRFPEGGLADEMRAASP